ncbi:unnamed protein product [Penicillium roqueforti FM164]|uniref:Genomic scaffold, ProqFM164S03 n=1 Tax=Penicillium roqueforti (strain FM164) TaxID=1365484 RepID=W6QCF2_PENRF|nr:unnamed protein product [Penicillium roqueforti FM164]
MTKYNHLFSCKICLKFRPRKAFADNQLRAKRGKGHAESDRRFCFDCGCENRIYRPGDFIKVDGHEEAPCACCGERCRYGLYCMFCRMCEPCVYDLPPLPISIVLSPSELEESRCPRCRHKDLFTDLGKPPGKSQPEDKLMAMKMSES